MSTQQIGIEAARAILGDLADQAHEDGTVTVLTRTGKPVAAITPIPADRRDEMSDGRYYSIRLMPDDSGEGTYRLSFSTQPGMSTSIGELRMGDLDALASILVDRRVWIATF